jgi:hypothetical protein
MPDSHGFTGTAISLAMLCISAFSCSSALAATSLQGYAAREARAPQVSLCDFEGVWTTTFGRLELEQEGARVSGRYTMGGEPATLEGTLEGCSLSFVYRETAASGSGRFELAPDGRSFSGAWKEDGQVEWSGWTGRRDGPLDFSGLWATSYGAMRLVEEGEHVRGTYEWAGGSNLAGTRNGQVLAFDYDQPDDERGRAEVTLAADGMSFEGTWEATTGLGGNWSGTRIVPQAGRTWLVILEAHWESGLAEHEYSYGDMLRAYFTRLPDVAVRHRFVHDVADVARFCRELVWLAEPVVLYISSHGTEDGISLGTQTASADDLISALEAVETLRLLHFGSCLVMNGDVPRRIHAARAERRRFPISGFTTAVDWGGSAIVDFTYLELVLARGMAPREALDWTRKTIAFAGNATEGPIPGTGLALLEPEDADAGVAQDPR